MEPVIVLGLAIAIDLCFGEPPTTLHPVGWIGRLIGALVAISPSRFPAAQLLYGGVMVVFVAMLIAAISYIALSWALAWHEWSYLLLSALLLKSTFSIRGLRRAAGRVKTRLQAGDLEAARHELRALVSRDTGRLSAGHLAAAAVESVAENAVDSFIAPVFFFALFTPAGAWAVVAAMVYRVVNTFDAMVGYRGRYEHLGKVAARSDDLLNWLPARLGGLFFVVAALLSRGDGSNAWRVMARDHLKTESPNAGWTMSAAAGALHVTLEKVGHYRLGDGREPGSETIARASRLALVAMLLFATVTAVLLLLM